MGWLKKLTKPISKVLDKIIPNEIKPALPYLSAFAPYMLPAGMAGGSGIAALLRRGALTGGINLASQLAQEGSEGEFSGLSALLAAGQGAMTAPGSAETLRGMKAPTGDFDPARSFLQKAGDKGLEGLAKGAEFLSESGKIISDPSQWGLNKETLGAFATPVTQGTGDLAMAEARRALADYNAGLDEGSDAWYDDNARRVAIRSAMEAAGHVEDDILDALASLGLRQGGIVGLKNGGRIGLDKGGDLSEFSIGNFRPFKYSGKIDDVWEEDAFGSDSLGWIMNIGYTVRAPLIDVIRTVAKTGAEAAKLIAAATKMGWDLTKSAREIIGDVGAAGVEGIKEGVKWSHDGSRFIQPLYYLERFAGDRNLTDDETRLRRAKRTSRSDPEDIRELENRVFNYENINVDQKPEDVEISERIKFNEKYNMADGGMMSVLPGGAEMDYRGGGMIPMGSKERADDVPARLSKNEFVMTADAVKAAGGGSVNRGAKRMYDLMHNLEARV